MTEQNDQIDKLRSDWQQEQSHLDTSGMEIVGRIMIHSERFHKSISERLKAFGLGYTDFDVLATIRRSGSPYGLKPAEILNSVLIQSGSLTSCIDRLEKAKLIVRKADAKDRRSLIVNLTAHGKAVVDAAAAERFAEAKDHISHLSHQEQETLKQLLKKLNP